ncbi:hypothetical protein [Brevibacillus laterosporus]|uniref:hypothetical protein n=1 Tax=Brevibacillus laterosporus TaxID=1465 RepID=UPI003D1EC4EB
MPKTFEIECNGEATEHEVGATECQSCFNKPEPCECGGLIHCQFQDYIDPYEGEIALFYQCDKCGEIL